MKQLIIILIFLNFYNCQANRHEAEFAPPISTENMQSPGQLEHSDDKTLNICDICTCNGKNS